MFSLSNTTEGYWTILAIGKAVDTWLTEEMAIYQVFLCVIFFGGACETTKWKSFNLHQLSRCPDQCTCGPLNKVDCTGRLLKNIPPELSNTTTILLLKDNFIEKLSASSFIHLLKLEKLDVSFNKIGIIENDTFSNLKHLSELDLSGNPIGVQNLGLVFCEIFAIEFLYLKSINFKDIKSDSFQCLQNTSVLSIDMSDSYHLCQGVHGIFRNIPQLITVKLVNSRCKKFSALLFENDSKIEDLQLGENKILNFPLFERDGKSVLVNIHNLNLSQNYISALPRPRLFGLKSLKFLDLSFNRIGYLEANWLSELRSLERLDLNNNEIYFIEEQALKSYTLKILGIEYNPINFTGTGKTAFKYTTAIEIIRMRGTRFIPSEFEEMFQNISTLKELTLWTMHGLCHIPQNTFRGLYNLTLLFLSENQIEEVHWNQFKDLISLQKLSLDHNEIHTFNITSFPRYVLQNLKVFRPEHNPFYCTCDLLWFKDFMQSNSQKMGWQVEKHMYCEFPEYRLLADMNLTAATCLYKSVSRLNVAVWELSVLSTAVVLLLSFYHRFRWHIRYSIFNLTLWMKRPKKHQVMDSDVSYAFDVFVCYNGEDSAWVMNVLVPEFEVSLDPPLKLCLFERNWMPGNDIVTLIGQSIEESRKILIILTNAFAQSEWCQLELTMAQQHMIEDDKENIVLVVMEELESEYITPRLQLEMKQRTYLEWTDDKMGQELFWRQLKYTLQKPNLSVVKAVPRRDVFI